MAEQRALDGGHERLRQALAEIDRLDREVGELEPRVRDASDRALLASLSACRRALMRVAFERLPPEVAS